MKWVGPYLMVGDSDDALVLDFAYIEEDDELGLAATQIKAKSGVVVPFEEMAVTIMKVLEAPEPWIETQVLRQWAIEPTKNDDDFEDFHP